MGRNRSRQRRPRRDQGTHEERIEYARKLWIDDPSLPLGTHRGVYAKVEDKFGKAPTREQLMRLHAEVAKQQRDEQKAKRDAAEQKREQLEQAARVPVISIDTMRRLRLGQNANPPEQDQREKKGEEMQAKGEAEAMGFKARARATTMTGELLDARQYSGGHYPPEFRRKVVEHIEARRKDGEQMQDLCDAIGIPNQTYYKWRHQRLVDGRPPLTRDDPKPAPGGDEKKEPELNRWQRAARTRKEREKTNPPSAHKLKLARHRIAAYEMRRSTNKSMREIAEAVGVSVSCATNYVNQHRAYAEAVELVGRDSLRRDELFKPEPETAADATTKFGESDLGKSLAAGKTATRKPESVRGQRDAREALKAAVEMMLEEIPNLASVSIDIGDDGATKIKFARRTVVEDEVEL